MTDLQKKLVEENVGLVYSITNKYKSIDGIDAHEYEGEAMLALCQSAIHYDESVGVKFSTYACTNIQNAINLIHRRANTQKRQHEKTLVSYNAPMMIDGKEMEMLEVFPSDANSESDAIFNDFVDRLTARMDEKDNFIVRRLVDGYTMKEISVMLGLTPQRIQQRLKRMRGKLKYQYRGCK